MLIILAPITGDKSLFFPITSWLVNIKYYIQCSSPTLTPTPTPQPTIFFLFFLVSLQWHRLQKGEADHPTEDEEAAARLLQLLWPFSLSGDRHFLPVSLRKHNWTKGQMTTDYTCQLTYKKTWHDMKKWKNLRSSHAQVTQTKTHKFSWIAFWFWSVALKKNKKKK